MSQGNLLRKVKIIGRTKDGNGDTMDSCDPNLFLNTLTYDVAFSDGEIKDHSSNSIAKKCIRN